jgi:hypothetical protein
MFFQKLNQVAEQLSREISGNDPIDSGLPRAISIWCKQLNIPQDENDYILRNYCNQYEIKGLINLLWRESSNEHDALKALYERINPFYYHINSLLNSLNIKGKTLKFVALIAFAVTAVGSLIYRLNQTIQIEKPIPNNPNSPSFIVQPLPVQIITKQFLVLVVSASQTDFLESLEAKRHIDSNDGEKLYEITKYLYLASETEFNQKMPNINNQYLVQRTKESEYDIHLISIELKQPEHCFKPNVDQLDRYDAFRDLDNLAIHFKISPRLQMEAYENIEVYNR